MPVTIRAAIVARGRFCDDDEVVDPAMVKKAIELKLIDPVEADRFLRTDDPSPPPLALVPTVAPPPERVTTVHFKGRRRRARASLTKRLIAAGVIGDNPWRKIS